MLDSRVQPTGIYGCWRLELFVHVTLDRVVPFDKGSDAFKPDASVPRLVPHAITVKEGSWQLSNAKSEHKVPVFDGVDVGESHCAFVLIC